MLVVVNLYNLTAFNTSFNRLLDTVLLSAMLNYVINKTIRLIIVIYFQGTYHIGIQDSTDHWEYKNELRIPVSTWGLWLCTSLYCILRREKKISQKVH